MPIDFVFKKSEHVVMSTQPITLKSYRAQQGLSLEQFGAMVGKSKGHIHAVEENNYATAKLALVIERETGGAVDAASLNPEIAEARKAAAQC